MMASCNGIEAQSIGALGETSKLQTTVAFNAGVWRGAFGVRCNVRLHHLFVEVVAEVEHQMVNTNLLSNTARIVDIGNRATTGIAFATPQAHGDANNVMAVLLQEGCCN
jgi:hypothetical protein